MAARHDDDLFAGGGETGALMRGIDWARTPLGPVEHWPRSLRTCCPRVAHLAPADVRLVGRRADQSLQRRLPQRSSAASTRRRSGEPAARGVERDLGRRSGRAVRPRSRATRARTTKRCCSSWSATAIRRRRTTRSPTARCPTTMAAPAGIFCANTDDTQRIVGERQHGAAARAGRAHRRCAHGRTMRAR